MPATGQFFNQRERKTGDYPVVDPFVTFHLKRANIFVKYDHVNQGFPGNDYFHTIGYPVNPRGVRFGLSWNFYD
ncbi:MAG: putative porin, partial [Bacteroidota bacterium]